MLGLVAAGTAAAAIFAGVIVGGKAAIFFGVVGVAFGLRIVRIGLHEQSHCVAGRRRL